MANSDHHPGGLSDDPRGGPSGGPSGGLSGGPRGGALCGLGDLVRFNLRRERVRILAWVLGIFTLVMVSALSVRDLFSTPESLASAAANSAIPAVQAFNGPPYALDTIGGQIAFQIGAPGLVIMSLMAIMMTGRLTRDEEQQGRTELIRSLRVGTLAPGAAAIIVVGLMSLAVGMGCAILLSMGSTAGDGVGSLAFGLGYVAIGWFFSAVTLVFAQLTMTGRATKAMAGAVLGVAYVVRAFGDATGSGLSWLSPLGWVQAMRPFAQERWWPLALPVCATAGLLMFARSLYLKRDIDSVAMVMHPVNKVLSRRSGDPSDTVVLTSVRALAMRLELGLIAGWAIGIGIGGLAYGLVVAVMEDFIADNEQLAEMMDAANGGSPIDAMIGASAKYLAVMAGAFAVQSALALHREEGEGRAELLLALPVTRRRYWNSFAVPTVAGSVAVLGTGGVLLGLGSWVSTGDGKTFVDGTLAVLAYLPAVLLFAAVSGLLFGWRPHWSLASWAAYALAASIAMFGPMLQLPGWSMNLSVFDAIPTVPGERLSPAPLLVVSAVVVLLFLVGRAGFESRDLETA